MKEPLFRSSLFLCFGWALGLVALACSEGEPGEGDDSPSTGGEGGADPTGSGGTSSTDDALEPGDEVPLGMAGVTARILSGIPRAVAAQGDSVLVTGTKDSEIWVTRVGEGAEVDSTFGEEGEALIGFPEVETTLGTQDFDAGFGLTVSGDAIFVVGAASGWNGLGDTRWGVVKLGSDGALDTAFAESGLKFIDWTIGSRAYRVQVGPEEKIYVSGPIENVSTDIAVVRLEGNGDVDPSFSLTGEGTGAVVSDNAYEDGTCLFVGDDYLLVGGGPDFGLARLELDGPYDTAFGTDGWSKPSDGVGYAMGILDDGKILLVGTAPSDEESGVIEELLVVRLNDDGTPDESFGDGGIARIDYDFESYVFPEAYDQVGFEDAFVRVTGLSVLEDGALLIQADVVGFLARYPALLRVNPDGTLDTDFAQAGLVAFPIALPLLAGLIPDPASRLVSDGSTAWMVEEGLFSGEARGVILEVDLGAL